MAEASRARARPCDALPPSERRALSLAFLDELSHDEVARFLKIPIGTAKSRIRAALERLRPVLIIAGVALGLVLLSRDLRRERDRAALEARALLVVTASDVETMHLSAAPGVPADQHGNYRARRGTGLAVLTCSNRPVLSGDGYRAWAQHDGAWIPLGLAVPDPNGKALVVAEDPRLTDKPDRVIVTRGDAPTSPVVLEIRKAEIRSRSRGVVRRGGQRWMKRTGEIS